MFSFCSNRAAFHGASVLIHSLTVFPDVVNLTRAKVLNSGNPVLRSSGEAGA